MRAETHEQAASLAKAKPTKQLPAEPSVGDARAAFATPELLSVVGKSLRALRTRKGLSLERLARASNVSRAMLGQIELAQSAPTITVLWRVASALGVPFSALLGMEGASRSMLMRAVDAVRLRSSTGGLVSRPLFPFGQGPRRSEFYELELSARALEPSQPHPAGTMENLVVSRGSVVVHVGSERHVLRQGDALVFQADVEHAYENAGDSVARMYLVMTYALELL